MGKYTNIITLGLVGFIGYYLYKGLGGLGESWKGGFENLYGLRVEQAEEMVITVPETQRIITINQQETQKLMQFLETQPANISLIEQYKKNVSDFQMWLREEATILLNAQTFVAINSVNPLFMLNPFNKSAMENAKSQILDSQNKIDYYRQQIELNKSKLRELGVWI